MLLFKTFGLLLLEFGLPIPIPDLNQLLLLVDFGALSLMLKLGSMLLLLVFGMLLCY